jgi:type II secretory pathway component PulK
MKNIFKTKKGQALVSLIVFISIAMIIISAMVTIIASNSILNSINQQSLQVKQAAENGIENALLNLLRNPAYTGEILDATLNGYLTVVTVSGDSINKTITSTSAASNYQWKIISKINYNENILTIISWQDSYE